jgi:hypothetical protein
MNDYDLQRAIRLKNAGIERAAGNRAELLSEARRYAISIAKLKGTVTADDIGRAGFELGPAAGAVFKDPRFKWTGEFRKSAKVKNHARLLRVWKLA